MELLIGAAGAAGILALIAFLSPGVERQRRPVHSMVGRDNHVRRVQRASLAAQVTQRNAPRPLRVTGDTIRPIEAPAVPSTTVLRVTPTAGPAMAPDMPPEVAPLQLPAPAVGAPRLDWARQASDSVGRNQKERVADGLVASLLGPTARAS